MDVYERFLDMPDEEVVLLAQNAEHKDWECTEEMMALTKDGKAMYMHCLPADITDVSCKAGEVAASVFDRYRDPLYKEASYKPYIIAAMIFLAKVKDPAAKLKELAAQCGNKGKNADDIAPMDGEDHGDDPKYHDAVRVAIEEGRISTSLLQRKLGVGYSRAAKLIDRMQAEEIVSPPDGSKPRSILITPEQYIERFVDNAEENGDSNPEA